MARVFSAIDIRDEEVIDKLVEVRDKADLGFNPVEKGKLHVTLEFFRDVDEDGIQELKTAMSRVDLESFYLDVRGLGSFPSRDHIRVVWAGAFGNKIYDLREQVQSHNIENDNQHQFKPHVTLLRVENLDKKSKSKLQRILREYETYDFGKTEVKKVRLYESELCHGSSQYKQIYSKELK